MIPRVAVALVIVLATLGAYIWPKTQFAKSINNTQAPQSSIITATNKEVKYPKPTAHYSEPIEITARSAVVIDEKTGISLFEKNPNLKHLPASTTKLMTALVALETCSPQETVVVNRLEKSGTLMGLEIGDRVTVENLLYGLLIASGNDAAYVLAENCAASLNSFTEKMNQKAKELQMANSRFMNPAGFDDNLQYSTALDLAELARVATANPLIAKIVKTKSTVVTDITGIKTYYMENVNKLLEIVDGVNGVKTGQTEGALEIVITKTNRGGNGIIVSVLGSHDRFGESQMLIEWAFNNHVWHK